MKEKKTRMKMVKGEAWTTEVDENSERTRLKEKNRNKMKERKGRWNKAKKPKNKIPWL